MSEVYVKIQFKRLTKFEKVKRLVESKTFKGARVTLIKADSDFINDKYFILDTDNGILLKGYKNLNDVITDVTTII